MKRPNLEAQVILLAEDKQGDIDLMRHAFKKCRRQPPLHVVRDGEEVLAYLKGEGAYSNREEYPLPHLLLLDLKMPRLNGFEVLHWIRNQPEFKNLVVVVLTASKEIWDVDTAYKRGANSFLVKPVHMKELVRLLDAVQDYWLEHNRNPHLARPFFRIK